MVRINGLFHLLINGIYWAYNPLANLLLTSWDIQVRTHTCLEIAPPNFSSSPARKMMGLEDGSFDSGFFATFQYGVVKLPGSNCSQIITQQITT